jgi:hypothetical protein
MQNHYTTVTIKLVEAEGVGPSSAAYRAAALPLSYASIPLGALVWNRTSISCASDRRHHQIGFESNVVAGVVPGHGYRPLFDCQRSRSAVAETVRG